MLTPTRVPVPKQIAFLLAALLAALSFLSPNHVLAQTEDDYQAPTVSITIDNPNTGTVGITVSFCDNRVLNASSRVIKLDGVSIKEFMTYTTQNGSGNCYRMATSFGNRTVSAGPHTVTASIRDGFANTGSDAASFTYTPPPPPAETRAVVVSPGMQHADVERGTTHTQVFTIFNGSPASQTFRIEAVCTEAGVPKSCTLGATTVTVGAGWTANATIGITLPSGATVPWDLKLRAIATLDSTVRDSGAAVVHPIAPRASGVTIAAMSAMADIERSLCVNVSTSPGAAYECGDLRLVHALPGIQTFGKAQVPTLIYNSRHAAPSVNIAADVTLPVETVGPTGVSAVVKIGGVAAAPPRSFSPGEWANGATRRIVLSFHLDPINQPSGIYPYTLEVTRTYASSSTVTESAQGEFTVVNRAASPFGAGWWLAGLEQLIHASGGRKLWIGGDGSTRIFVPTGQAGVWTATSVDHEERLEEDTLGFCRRLQLGECIRFSSAGHHVESRGRLAKHHPWAHRTRFVHDGGGKLSSIEFPVVGDTLIYTFAYDGVGRLDSVLAPVGKPGQPRNTQITTNGSGQVTSIRDPDLTSVSFEYPGVFPGARIDQRGTRTEFVFTDRLLTQTKMILDTSLITFDFDPAEAKGGPGRPSASLAQAYTRVDGPRIDVADTTLFFPGVFGAPEKVRDALGNDVLIRRRHAIWPAVVTSTIHASGVIDSAIYNARGDLTSTTRYHPEPGRLPVTTAYTWDTTWNRVKTITPPAGPTTTFSYDPDSGYLDWQQLGTDPARRVTFAYNSLGLLISTLTPLSAPDSIHYDSLGNVRTTRTPMGITGHFHKDGIGRDTLVLSPISPAKFDSVRTVYDAAGQDTLITRSADTMSVVVRKHYDPAGNLDTLWQKALPDINEIGWTTRVYQYDRANRQVHEQTVGGSYFTLAYDRASNQRWDTRGLNGGETRYDVLNRPVERISDDTSVFSYDESGNMLTAHNKWARINRAYYADGSLRADTLRIATVTGNDFSKHVYGIQYGYDAAGRQAWLKHPRTLRPTGRDSVAYSYNAADGQLDQIEDITGTVYRYYHNVAGQMDSLRYRATHASGPVERRTYDFDGRTKWRNGGALDYDVRGKLVRAGFDTMTYGPLGHLIEGTRGTSTEKFIVDGLGNRYMSEVSGESAWTQDEYDYDPGTGVLRQKRRVIGTPRPDTTFYSGGSILLSTRTHTFTGHSDGGSQTGWEIYEARVTTNSYNRDGRMEKSWFRLDTLPNPQYAAGYQSYEATETYRYDALGRRIWTRMIRGKNCENKDKSSGCRSTVTRTVWDGDHILHEVRAPGTDTTYVDLEYDGPGQDAFHGVVTYTHGKVIDQPLAVIKGASAMHPLTNARGAISHGTCPDVACSQLDIWFPAGSALLYGGGATRPTGPPSWYGSLIEDQQDGSGYQYRRNRYYDPSTGRFTQEDPIGIAGGLNTFGYANGDPVNFSDPFGLNPVLGGAAAATPLALAGLGLAEQAVPGIGTVVGTLTLGAAAVWALYEGVTALADHLEARKGSMKPDSSAEGAHTTIVRDAKTGKVKKYQEWQPNEPRHPKDKRKFKPGPRLDRNGPVHTNPDGTKVPTPHIQQPNGVARPARPNEIPR